MDNCDNDTFRKIITEGLGNYIKSSDHYRILFQAIKILTDFIFIEWKITFKSKFQPEDKSKSSGYMNQDIPSSSYPDDEKKGDYEVSCQNHIFSSGENSLNNESTTKDNTQPISSEIDSDFFLNLKNFFKDEKKKGKDILQYFPPLENECEISYELVKAEKEKMNVMEKEEEEEIIDDF